MIYKYLGIYTIGVALTSFSIGVVIGHDQYIFPPNYPAFCQNPINKLQIELDNSLKENQELKSKLLFRKK
jgi:hypothetical protein